VELSRHRDAAVDLPAFTALSRGLALMGHGADARLASAADYVARAALLGRGTAAKALLLFAALPEEGRSPVVRRAVDFLRARALEAGIPREGAAGAAPESLRSGFPNGEESDLVELLYASPSRRPRGRRRRGRSRSRGACRSFWPGPTTAAVAARAGAGARASVSLERAGEMSRWVTIRALIAVQRFLGLTIDSARAVPGSARR